MKKIKWGILSTANIGVQKVIPAMQASEYCEIVAIASRDLGNAQNAAARVDIRTAYGSYEELLADSEIEAIYNPLPNHLHVPYTIKALQAGKHVLCEKPIALTVKETQELISATKAYPHLKVMEAFMYRFHPQWLCAKKLVEEGRIGVPKTVQAFFSYYNDNPENIRNKKDIGGGGLMDIGCYCISQSRYLFGKEPQKIQAHIEYDEKMGTDKVASAMLDFGNETAVFTCSTQLSPFQNFRIFGTEGMIDLEIPVNVPPDKTSRIWLQTASSREEFSFEPVDQYTLQADAFCKAIIHDLEVPTPLTDALNNMLVIEAVKKSGDTNQWTDVEKSIIHGL